MKLRHIDTTSSHFYVSFRILSTAESPSLLVFYLNLNVRVLVAESPA